MNNGGHLSAASHTLPGSVPPRFARSPQEALERAKSAPHAPEKICCGLELQKATTTSILPSSYVCHPRDKQPTPHLVYPAPCAIQGRSLHVAWHFFTIR